MKVSLPCRGLGSAKLPARQPLPAAPSVSGRKLVSRIVCQQATDQAGNPVQDVEAPAPLPMYPVPLPPQVGQEGSTAVYAPPPGYQYQMPQRMQQEYYMQAPPGYYPPPAPYKAQEASSGAPWWLWVGVGILAANVLGKVQEFMKNPRSPQQMMAEMAMKQMMGAMGNQGGAASPFGKAGMPPFPGGMPPGMGMPPGFPAGGFAQAAAAAASAAPVDVSSSPASSTASPAEPRKGDKFSSRLNTQSTSSPSSSAAEGAKEAAAPSGSGFMDVVEPIVKEPASGPTTSSSRSSASFFADVSSSPSSTSTSSSSGGPSGGAQAAGAGNGTNGASSAAGGGTGAAEAGSVMSDMMENMLRNPEMQKMLYPYLPEPMRNPSSIEWMLNNPEVKKQMTSMFEQQNMMSPQMMEMMKGMDFNQDKVNQQFQELGLKPEDVITKVMSNPELAAGFQSPKVQAAIMDISQNPMNVMKYQNDPEVMKVLEQVTTLFQPDISQAKR